MRIENGRLDAILREISRWEIAEHDPDEGEIDADIEPDEASGDEAQPGSLYWKAPPERARPAKHGSKIKA